MQISMIFFTIVIERRKKSAEETAVAYLRAQTIRRWEEERFWQTAYYPPYGTRL